MNDHDRKILFYMLVADFQEMYVLLKCVCNNDETAINKEYFYETGTKLLDKWVPPNPSKLEKNFEEYKEKCAKVNENSESKIPMKNEVQETRDMPDDDDALKAIEYLKLKGFTHEDYAKYLELNKEKSDGK